jgi:hypothetical protein
MMVSNRRLEGDGFLEVLNGLLESRLMERDAPEIEVGSRVIGVARRGSLEASPGVGITVRLERRNRCLPILSRAAPHSTTVAIATSQTRNHSPSMRLGE